LDTAASESLAPGISKAIAALVIDAFNESIQQMANNS